MWKRTFSISTQKCVSPQKYSAHVGSLDSQVLLSCKKTGLKRSQLLWETSVFWLCSVAIHHRNQLVNSVWLDIQQRVLTQQWGKSMARAAWCPMEWHFSVLRCSPRVKPCSMTTTSHGIRGKKGQTTVKEGWAGLPSTPCRAQGTDGNHFESSFPHLSFCSAHKSTLSHTVTCILQTNPTYLYTIWHGRNRMIVGVISILK